jgi:hypothetical protein
VLAARARPSSPVAWSRYLGTSTLAVLLVSLTIAPLVFGVQFARAEVAKPVIHDVSVSHITAHGALLEADFSSVSGLWVHAGFVLQYRGCASCVGVRDLRFEGGLGVATARTLTLRAELTDLPSATRQSFTLSVTAETPFKPRSAVREATPAVPAPPKGPIIVEHSALAPVVSEEPEPQLLREVPERASAESAAVSFVTAHSDPAREANRRRASGVGVTRAVERVAAQIGVDFRRAPRGHRVAYPIVGTERKARVVEYKLISAEHKPLGELSLQEIYATRPIAQLDSVFVWEKLRDAAYNFLFEARRVRAADWAITRVGCTCGTALPGSAVIGEESPLTPDRFQPILSYAQAVLRDLQRRVLPEAFSPSAEPPLWDVSGAQSSVVDSEHLGAY